MANIVITCDTEIATLLKYALIRRAEIASKAYGTDIFFSEPREALIKQADKFYAMACELDEIIENSEYSDDEGKITLICT